MRQLTFERLHNFRDLGGYPGEGGRPVRWRTLYRADSLAVGDLAGRPGAGGGRVPQPERGAPPVQPGGARRGRGPGGVPGGPVRGGGIGWRGRALLVGAGLLDADTPSGIDAWVAAHGVLHQGSAMLAALSRAGSELTTAATAMLWRLVDGRGGAWTEPATRVPDALDAIRQAEERRIAAGTLPSVGILASIRR